MTEEGRRFTDKFALRLPEGLRDRLAEQAAINSRSTNSEMVARLERSLEDVGDTAMDERAMLAEINRLKDKLADLTQAFMNHVTWHLEKDPIDR